MPGSQEEMAANFRRAADLVHTGYLAQALDGLEQIPAVLAAAGGAYAQQLTGRVAGIANQVERLYAVMAELGVDLLEAASAAETGRAPGGA